MKNLNNMKLINRIVISAVAVAAVLTSSCCSPKVADSQFFDRDSAPAIPCYITEDTSVVILRDYFPRLERVEALAMFSEPGFRYEHKRGTLDTLKVIREEGAPRIAMLQVVTEGGQRGYVVLKQQNESNEDLPAIATTAFDSDLKGFSFASEGEDVQYVVLWQNTVLGEEFVSEQEGGIHVSVPANAAAYDRSYIRVYSYNEHGTGNDLLVPIANGKIIVDTEDLVRQDRQTWMMYQILIDRFYNGNTANDWRFNSPDVLPKADYYGGDLAGVDAKLLDGYFDELGINTIWLSPITQNPYTAWGLNKDPYTKFSGYHGYWPVYMTKVDDRFGTPEELRKLIADVHADDKNIILDYVANHLHLESPVLQAHPEWKTPMYTEDGRLNLELWDEYRLTTWFDKHIPTLNLELESAAEPLSDSAVFWMTEYDFEGFRHDATKHIPEIYWRKLTKKLLTQVDRSVFQIGETYGSPALISSYVRSGMLDCQFDFNIYDTFIAATTQSDGSFDWLSSTINESLQVYGYHNLMGLISGNHDRPRYISVAGGDVLLSEDTKKAGWKRNIGVGDSVAYDKLIMLHAMNFTLPGIPIIYTGDEFGQPGANDPDNRRWSQFEPQNAREAGVFETVQSLAAERSSNMALLYGDYYELASEQDFFCYMRVYMGQYVIVALNKSAEAMQKEVELPFGLEFMGSDSISLEVPAYGYTMLKN